MTKHINSLTEVQIARMDEWADKWIEIGLRTGEADRQKFEESAERCYRAANIPWPGRVVWVPSPIVLAIAAPVAALVLHLAKRGTVDDAVLGAVRCAVNDAVDGVAYDVVDDAVDDAVRGVLRGAVDDAIRVAVGSAVGSAVDGAVDDAVRDAVDGAVGDAVRGAVGDAVGGAVGAAVRSAVRGAMQDVVYDAMRDVVRGAVGCEVLYAVNRAVPDAVRSTVRGAVDDAVRGAAGGAVGAAVRDAVRDAVRSAVGGAVRGSVNAPMDRMMIRQTVASVISNSWHRIIGGQFWAGGWYWGGAFTSYFREVCGLDLADDLWERSKAYEATMESACWWYPHRDFIMVSERPKTIHRELVRSDRPRGQDSHRLHCDTGPAVAWDGWGVYAVHGVLVPDYVVEQPSAITVEDIDAESNAEVRRVMIDRYGPARYVVDSGAIIVQELAVDHPLPGLRTARLMRKPVPGDEDIVYVDLLNSTPEPDGSVKRYMLRVDPRAYRGEAARSVHAAVASTWRNADGTLAYARWQDYAPAAES